MPGPNGMTNVRLVFNPPPRGGTGDDEMKGGAGSDLYGVDSVDDHARRHFRERLPQRRVAIGPEVGIALTKRGDLPLLEIGLGDDLAIDPGDDVVGRAPEIHAATAGDRDIRPGDFITGTVTTQGRAVAIHKESAPGR